MDPYATPTSLFRRLFSTSWPLFCAFGVRVRVHWTTVLVPLSFYLGFVKAWSPGVAAAWAAAWTAALYLVVWTHEMGHIWAGRSLGVRASAVTLWPLGGLAHLDQGAPSPRGEIWIALAGPATHLVWFFVVGAPYFFFLQGTPADGATWAFMVKWFVWLNASLFVFNLLPFWPMDGGRTLRALMSLRMHPNHASLLAAYAGYAGAGVLGITALAILLQGDPTGFGSSWGGPILLGIAFTNFLACRNLVLESRWGDGPYRSTAEPWRQSIPQASWSMEDPTPAEPVVVEERRSDKQRRGALETQRKREGARAAARPLQERIDELLDRINEVGGIEKLSEAERKELAEASEKLRRGDR